MNIIAISGSPRRGNTEFVLKRFLLGAEKLGHKVELVLLREKRIERCCGCLECDKEGKCHIVDDMSIIGERMRSNELIVFGSPVYYSTVSGLMKDFFDRMNPFYSNKQLGGKSLVSVYVGAQPNMPDKALAIMETMANSMGMNLVGDLYISAERPQDVENDPEGIKKIDDFVNNILS